MRVPPMKFGNGFFLFHSRYAKIQMKINRPEKHWIVQGRFVFLKKFLLPWQNRLPALITSHRDDYLYTEYLLTMRRRKKP